MGVSTMPTKPLQSATGQSTRSSWELAASLALRTLCLPGVRPYQRNWQLYRTSQAAMMLKFSQITILLSRVKL